MKRAAVLFIFFSSHFCAFCIPWQSSSACAALSLTSCKHSHSQENDDETAKQAPRPNKGREFGGKREKTRRTDQPEDESHQSLFFFFVCFMYSRHMYVRPRKGGGHYVSASSSASLFFSLLSSSIQRLFLPQPTPRCLRRKLLNLLLSPPFVSPLPCSLHSTLPCNLSVLCR